MKFSILTLAVAGIVSLASPASALLFSGTGSGGRAASADFSVSGNNLIVRLSNTASYDAAVPTDLLTAVFFNIGGNTALTPLTAILAPGSTILNPGPTPTDPGNSVGGEWAYVRGASALASQTGAARQGISSTGLGIFGPGDLFPGSNLDGPSSPNGPQYGITTASDNPANNNGGADEPIIRNSVIFTLSGLPTGFDLSTISDVAFLYGTALGEVPTVPGRPPGDTVPDGGATVALLGLGLAAMGASRCFLKF